MLVRTIVKGLAFSTIAAPGAAWCLGLGDITVDTVLNQPLRAEIKLLSVSPGELDDVRVSLASNTAFERIGIQRPFVLSRLQFQPKRTPDGHASLEVTTSEPIREPFLNFLVEVEWSRGRLLREYTVLLNPPLPTEPRHAASVQATSAVGALNKSSGRRAAGEPVEYTVAPGDTLYGIAERYLPDVTVSLSQLMVAILRVNPDAFAQGNVNNLMADAVLRIPTGDTLVALDEQAAFAEVARQNALWHGDQAKPEAESASLVDVQATGSTRFDHMPEPFHRKAAGIRDQMVADDAAGLMTVPTEESRQRTMASKAPSAETAAVSAKEARDKDAVQTRVVIGRESAESRQVEIATLTSKLAELESTITKQERVILLQAKALTELQQRLDDLDAAENRAIAPGVSRVSASERKVVAGETAWMATAKQDEDIESAKEQATETGLQNSKPAILSDSDTQQSTPAQTVAPARSVGVIEALFASPAMLQGLGAGGILLLMLVWLVARATACRAEIIDSTTYSGEKLDAVQGGAGTVFIDSRRDDILALDKSSHSPDEPEIMQDKRIEYRLKLLEVQYTTKDLQGFETEAEALHQFLTGKPSGVW